MGRDRREEARTEAMAVATKQAIQEMTAQQEVDKLPGEVRELLGEMRALVGISDLCRLVAIKRIQQIKQYCLEHRINWERVCEGHLPKCRRSIDHYLDTLETFGDGTYESIIELTTHAERVAARRLMKAGTLRLDGDCLVIADRRVRNVPEEAHTVLEILRESMVREEAAKAEAAQERTLRKQAEAFAEKREAALIEARDAALEKIQRLEERPTPKELRTALDRKWWPILQEIRTAWVVRQGQLAAMIDEDDHSRAFWCGVQALLAEVQEGVYTLAMQLLGSRGNDYEAIVNLERGAPIQLGTNPAWPIPETPPERILRLQGGNGHDTTPDHPAA